MEPALENGASAMSASDSDRNDASSAMSATSVIIGGRALLSFAGCNYLGLAQHPRVIEALARNLVQYGISCGASRETTGNTSAHEELEHAAARFLGCEAALLAPDGYLANLVAAQALAADHDVALVDEKSHASLRDALIATRFRVVEYRHANAESAQRELQRVGAANTRVALFTDGVFPAHGSIAPLRELVRILPHARSTLVVDDCHATGVLGARGRGTCEHLGLSDPRVVITTTLSKAFGCFGGLIVCSRDRVRSMRERSRAYVGSSPIPPALACAGSAAIAELAADPSRLSRLRTNIARLRSRFVELGLTAPVHDLPVFPFTLDSIERMQRVHADLVASGILAPYIRYPDGMDDQRGYFRVALSAEHTDEHIDRLASALGSALRR
jgi:7-keto-8-aminopelargonate synthetase-like enzyme